MAKHGRLKVGGLAPIAGARLLQDDDGAGAAAAAGGVQLLAGAQPGEQALQRLGGQQMALHRDLMNWQASASPQVLPPLAADGSRPPSLPLAQEQIKAATAFLKQASQQPIYGLHVLKVRRRHPAAAAVATRRLALSAHTLQPTGLHIRCGVDVALLTAQR